MVRLSCAEEDGEDQLRRCGYYLPFLRCGLKKEMEKFWRRLLVAWCIKADAIEDVSELTG